MRHVSLLDLTRNSGFLIGDTQLGLTVMSEFAEYRNNPSVDDLINKMYGHLGVFVKIE